MDDNSLGKVGGTCAILMGILRVSDEDIVADYEASNEDIEKAFAAIARDPERQGSVEKIPPVFRRADPAIMKETIDAFNKRYGSMESFALEHGVSGNLANQLRRRLLD